MIKKVLTHTLLFFGGLAAVVNGYAQYAPPAPPAGPAICAWPSVPMRSFPGRDAGELVEGLMFGEVVTFTNRREFVDIEKRYYVLAYTAEGKQGWVHEHLFVPGGQLGVMLDYAKVYKRPASPATITDAVFSPAELVIVADQAGDWVFACNREKKKSGWISNADQLVSLNPRDVELATLHDQALLERNPRILQQKLDQLTTRALQEGSPLATHWYDAETNAYAYSAPPQAPARVANPSPALQPQQTARRYDPEPAPPAQAQVSRGLPPVASSKREGAQAQVWEERVTVSPITHRQEQSLFAAYHPTLPAGTLIRMELPKGGFIELTLMGPLDGQAGNALAISQKAFQLFFGGQTPVQTNIYYQSL